MSKKNGRVVHFAFLNLRWPHSVWSDPSSLFMWTNVLCRTNLALRHSLDVFTCSFLAFIWALSRGHLAEDTWAPSFDHYFVLKWLSTEGKNNLLWFQSFFYEGITWMFGLKSATFYWHLFVFIFFFPKTSGITHLYDDFCCHSTYLT